MPTLILPPRSEWPDERQEWPAEPPSPAPRDLLNLEEAMEARIRANLGLDLSAESIVHEANDGAALQVEPPESLPLDTQSWKRWQESEREKSLAGVASHLRICPQAETWRVNVRVRATVHTNANPPVVVCGCGKRWQPSRDADRFLSFPESVIRKTLAKLLFQKPATVWALILEEEEDT